MPTTQAAIREAEYRTRFFSHGIAAHVVPLYINMLLGSVLMFVLIVITTAAASSERLGLVTAIAIALLCAVSAIIALAEALPFRQQHAAEHAIQKPLLRYIVLGVLVAYPIWHMVTNTRAFLLSQARESVERVVGTTFTIPMAGPITITLVDVLALVIVLAPTVIIAMVINLHRVDPFQHKSLLAQWSVIGAREKDSERALQALNTHAAYILTDMTDLRPGHDTITREDRETLQCYQTAMLDYTTVVAKELQAVGIYAQTGEPISLSQARAILEDQRRPSVPSATLPQRTTRRSTLAQELQRRGGRQ